MTTPPVVTDADYTVLLPLHRLIEETIRTTPVRFGPGGMDHLAALLTLRTCVWVGKHVLPATERADEGPAAQLAAATTAYSRLTAYLDGFGDYLDNSDQTPWTNTVATALDDLGAALGVPRIPPRPGDGDRKCHSSGGTSCTGCAGCGGPDCAERPAAVPVAGG